MFRTHNISTCMLSYKKATFSFNIQRQHNPSNFTSIYGFVTDKIRHAKNRGKNNVLYGIGDIITAMYLNPPQPALKAPHRCRLDDSV